MRIIKPGKLGVGSPAVKEQKKRTGKRSERSVPEKKEREIWDDFQGGKKQKKRKEYERNSEGRLVQKRSSDRDKLSFQPEDELEGDEPTYKPRSDFDQLEGRIGYEFSKQELFERALTHRSVLGFQERSDYERLEFIGDAVLDLSVAHLLSDLHPNAREGDLSKMRAALVNTSSLAEIARELEVGPFIRLGRGELASGGADRPSILADVMEAIIGAIYWDSSYESALGIIESIFGQRLEVVTPSDPKTELQEALHAAGSEPPNYLVELVEGPEHAPTFVTVVVVDGEVAGRGRGATKKAAQQEAASVALLKLTPSISDVVLVDGQTAIIESALLAETQAEPTAAESISGDS
ncbi:MAG: ribonuclease III [Bdellovibrionales bacterium]|nr:ribonuclease III [Bdellovibrionales bacterium]